MKSYCPECGLPTFNDEPQNHEAACRWHDQTTCPQCAEIGPNPVMAEDIGVDNHVGIRRLKHRLA
jgi:hypothetical protein